MCGIFGCVGSSLPDTRSFTRALNLITHRGPDGSGFIEFPGGIFGHRRLSIIDLSDASSQPFETDSVILTFNGEIYNYLRLRSELERLGVVFRSSGDTEVIARAYETWGIAGFGRLEGMFAFALHDRLTGETHLVRDIFGIKPLYFASTASHTIFASEVKPLLALRGGARINSMVLEEICVWGFPLSQNSFFDEIEQAPPASVLTFRGNEKVRVTILPAEPRPEDKRGERSLETVLRDSIADHMIADVPVAIALSGGLDSSIVAALAHDLNPDLVTFTTTFSDEEDDEVRAAREVARHCGLRNEVIKLEVNDLEERLYNITYHLEEPIANPNVFPTFGLSQVIHSAGFKVVLMGEGSDEIFAGYPWHHAALEWFANDKSMYRGYLRRRGQGEFRKYLFSSIAERVDARSQEFQQVFIQAAGDCSSRLERLLAFEMAYQLQFSQLLRVDKMMMSHSVEARVPFLYRSILLLARSLPTRRKIKTLRWGDVSRDNKIALSEVAKRILPASIANRPKFGPGGTVNLWTTPMMQDFDRACASILTSSHYKAARDLLSEWIDWSQVNGLSKKQMFTLCQFVMTCHVHITSPAYGK
jgi:asparagine synthase (glutamine-hydrolysing)